MKRFFGFVTKEFYHIFRDVRTILILFGMPIAQILIFGYVITNEIKDVNIAVLDHSKDEVTREITDKLLSSGYFILNKKLETNDQIQEEFEKGDIREVIIFGDNFARKLQKEKAADVQIITDASDANTANLVRNYTQAIINDYVKEKNATILQPARLVPEIRMLFNPELKGTYMYVPGTMAMILMLISAMMTSITIAREKEMGTMEVLLVSPLRPAQIILGKVAPYVMLSFANAVSIIVLGYFVFGVPVQGSLVLLLAESLLFITLALSLGILISTVSTGQQMAMFISMFALMLPTILLSGFIFPIENMPEILQWLTLIMPPRWFITIIKNIMVKGTGLLFVWKETLILVGITLVFIVLSVRNFKIRLE
ncbi:MAG: ABC transporter permease [Bacteroidales bacterium]|nr:ABC transporter permease [Bacteroidales bacterium]